MGKNYYLCGGDTREGVPWASVSFRHKKMATLSSHHFLLLVNLLLLTHEHLINVFEVEQAYETKARVNENVLSLCEENNIFYLRLLDTNNILNA